MRSRSVISLPRTSSAALPERPKVLRPAPWGRVGWFVLAVVLGMQIGPIAVPLGHTVDRTRWADWIDLAVPYFVLGLAAWVLSGLTARRSSWVLLAAGGVVFTQGHGLHLSANSVGNVVPGPTEHLWDEIVGHYLWYAGLALVIFAIARELAPRALPTGRSLALAYLGAVALGVTIFDNLDEGGTVLAGSFMVAAFVAYGWRFRATSGRLLFVAYGLTGLALVGWGLYWGGWPQFSQLGWI
ncbi:MAG: hypothetical protein QOI76_1645 [Frankiales bacterium]|nr:hypothetical protein [Frankiales bacterium]